MVSAVLRREKLEIWPATTQNSTFLSKNLKNLAKLAANEKPAKSMRGQGGGGSDPMRHGRSYIGAK